MRLAIKAIAILITVLWAGAALRAPASEIAAHTPWMAALFPPSPQALAETLDRAQSLDPTAQAEALAAHGETLLGRAPLSPAPLTLAAARAVKTGQYQDAARYLSVAVPRAPREESARVWSAAVAVVENQPAAALNHLARLLILDDEPERATAYLDAIASLVQSPEGRAWLTSPAFADQPAAPRIVQHLNGVLTDFPLLLSLNQDNPDIQGALITRVLHERGADAAFILWLSLVPPEAVSAISWPFNSRFEPNPAPAPFNWNLPPRISRMEPGRGLIAAYTGRGGQTFAAQLMMLGPGRYRFRSRISGDGQPRGGGFVWQALCWGSNVLLGRSDRTGHREAPPWAELEIVVPPENCGGVLLSLEGEPGEFPMRARATVESVALEALPDEAPE